MSYLSIERKEQGLCRVEVSILNAQGIQLELKPPGESPLIAQPPHDRSPGNASMLHYTWGILVEEGGNKVWTFDKREYVAAEYEKQVGCIL